MPGDNKSFTRIQGSNSSSTCIPPPRLIIKERYTQPPLNAHKGERRQDAGRRHSDLYSRVKTRVKNRHLLGPILCWSSSRDTKNELGVNSSPQFSNVDTGSIAEFDFHESDKSNVLSLLSLCPYQVDRGVSEGLSAEWS